MKYESLKGWANIISSSLKMKKVGEDNELFVSVYTVSGAPRFSVRLNNVDNRRNNINTTELLFLVHEIINNNSFKTPKGLNLSHSSNIEIFWPERSGLQAIYKKFSHEYASANSALRQELLIEACGKWESDIQKRIAP